MEAGGAGVMAKGKKSNILLSTLEEIKQSSAEDEIASQQHPEPPTTPDPPKKKPPKRASAGSLLDNLISEAKAEAEQEVQEFTRSMDEKARLQKQERDAQEKQKKEQYERLIKEEADRRMGLIRKKEDEKRRQEEAIRQREEARILREKHAIERARATKQRKRVLIGLLVLTIVGAGSFAAVYLFDDATIGAGPPKDADVTRFKAKAHKLVLPPIVKDPDRKPIDTPAVPEIIKGIDGPVSIAVDLPDRTDADTLQRTQMPNPRPNGRIDVAAMGKEVTKAFEPVRSKPRNNGNNENDNGTLNINTNVFKDP